MPAFCPPHPFNGEHPVVTLRALASFYRAARDMSAAEEQLARVAVHAFDGERLPRVRDALCAAVPGAAEDVDRALALIDALDDEGTLSIPFP